MKQLSVYKWLIRLIRLPNLVIIGLSMILVQWCILLPAYPGVPTQWHFYFLISLAYTLLIAAAGYIYNDIQDQPIDLINKPEKTVVSIYISQSTATNLYNILTFTGIALSVYLSFLLRTVIPVMIAVAAALLLYGYAIKWKKAFLSGNLAVSFLCMLTIWQPWLLWAYSDKIQVSIPSSAAVQNPLNYLGLYAALAFLSTLFRELVKDVQDMEGDRLYGCRTVPIVWGIEKTKWLLLLVAIISIFVSLNLLLLQWWQGHLVFILIFLIINILPFYYLLYQMKSAQKAGDFKKINYLALYHILSGTLTMLALKL